MNINEIAKLTQLSAKSIRFYEEKGIITTPLRALNGYRQYNQQHIDELNLLNQAKLAGFSLTEAKELLELYKDPHRRNIEVKEKTLAKIAEIDAQIAKLQAMKTKLSQLANQCPADGSAHCPIIEGLAEGMIEKTSCCGKKNETN